MPFKTIPNTTVTYALIAFDGDGHERTDDPDGINGRMSARILQEAQSSPPNHIFFFSHGWKGDVPAAIDQDNRSTKATPDSPADMATIGSHVKHLWSGLHRPSLPWGDDELGSNAFEASSVGPHELVERYVSRLGGNPDEVRSLLRIIVQ